MRLGVEFPQSWKEKSKKEDISLSDILYGYAIENLMLRINKSSFREYLWISNEQALGEEAYKKVSKERLEFLYVEKEKKINPVFAQMVEKFLEEVVFSQDEKEQGLSWRGAARETEQGYVLSLVCHYMDMQVPVTIVLRAIKYEKQIPKEKELKLMFENKKVCTYLSYSRENILSEMVFELMRKLELISDMRSYDQVNEILKSQTINGRRVLDELKTMGEKEPKVVSMKRMEMLSSYIDYGYMKKKWQQYGKKQLKAVEDWEVVMTRILAFLGPIWKALCENEIFFDDWMPELERFLG